MPDKLNRFVFKGKIKNIIKNPYKSDTDKFYKDYNYKIMISDLEVFDNKYASALAITNSKETPFSAQGTYGKIDDKVVKILESCQETHKIEKFHIDIATGDPITPREIRYKYIPLLGDNYINLYAYNIETVLAEKIETILSRSELNGRMRDFYDVYLIYTREWKNVNIDNFRKAIDKTFAKREYIGEPLITIDVLRESELIRSRWKIYQRKYEYAKDIDFDDILDCILKMMEKRDHVVV